MSTRPIPDQVAARAAARYTEDEAGCHISDYSLGSHGYAQIGWWDKSAGKSRMTVAHRAAWTFHEGPIPAGMTIDHLCHVRACVRRSHLRLLSNHENARDNGQERRNPESGSMHSCGQPLALSPAGVEYCRACQNAARRLRRSAKKAVA